MSQLTKRCTNELVATQKSETRFLIVVADRQQRKALAVHYCNLASQSPLTSSCSGVRFKTNCVCRVPNGGFRSRKSKLLAAKLQLYLFFFARARCLSAGLRYLRLTRLPRHDRGPVPGGNRSAASCLCTVLRRALYHYATRSPSQIAIVPPPLRGAAPWQWLGRSHRAGR